MEKEKPNKILVSVIAVVTLVAVTVAAFAVYVNDYYEAKLDAVQVMASTDKLSVSTVEDTIIYMPKNPKAGLIFYPGGKVEYISYIPLMEACASKGVACVLVEMPFNLAVFDVNAADGICEMYPEIGDWYIGGHSLGGSMAASYLSENEGAFEGLVLLGSYSTADLSESGVDVLSVYGSEDKVLNRDKYNENLSNLPEDFTEVVLDGGCHAYFGMYGEQEGDGIPAISNAEQIEKTADAIAELVDKQ